MTEGEPPADEDADETEAADSDVEEADEPSAPSGAVDSDVDPRADNADSRTDASTQADADAPDVEDTPDAAEDTRADTDSRAETGPQTETDSRDDTGESVSAEADDSASDPSETDPFDSAESEDGDVREAEGSLDAEAYEAAGLTDTDADEPEDHVYEPDDASADESGVDEPDETDRTGADETAEVADSEPDRRNEDSDVEETDGASDLDAYEFDDAGGDDNTGEDASEAGADEPTQSETDEFEGLPSADTSGTTGAGAASGAGATAAGAGAGGGGGIGTGTGAPDDQEMPLTEHIEEMVKRVGVVIVVMAVVSALTFPFADRLINFLWYSFLPGSPTECAAAAVDAFAGSGSGSAGATDAACPRIYHPLSLLLARLKVASLTGFVIALPIFVYQTYLFMRPGLYPNERRYYLSSVPTSLILAGVGMAFAYFLVLPVIFTYFLGYSQPVAEIAFGLADTFDLIILMLGMFALIFQIPLFVMLAIMMNVTSRGWLEDRRLYFWAGFAGIAFLFSPDPTGMAPFIVAVTMIVLFEGTLLLLRWTGR